MRVPAAPTLLFPGGPVKSFFGESRWLAEEYGQYDEWENICEVGERISYHENDNPEYRYSEGDEELLPEERYLRSVISGTIEQVEPGMRRTMHM